MGYIYTYTPISIKEGKLINIFMNEEKRTILFLLLSAVSLIISFFFAKQMIFNPAWIAVIFCGIPIIKGAAEALIKEHDIKADLLVSLALIASVIIGEIFAAGEVAFIMTLGAMLEERTVKKARAGIEKLVHLTPRTARIIRGGEEHIISAEQVQINDIVRVLAGETIAVDGVITQGKTTINQSVMTGESLPVDKSENDEVFSGTVNQFGSFDMRATKICEDSSLQRMIRLVESANADKAKIVGIADRWATWIVIIALVSACITWAVTGEIIRAVTILVVFCPCALVLATPTAIMAGIGNATKYGILIREGDVLERLDKIKRFAFDKTGTLTYGKPAVITVESFIDDISENQLFRLIAAAERRSEHPLGKAITDRYKKQNGTLPEEPQEFKLVAGRGVEAIIDGKQVVAGNSDMLSDYAVFLPDKINEKALIYKNDGCTVIFAAINNKAAGIIALSDEIRPDAAPVVNAIRHIGIKTALLTGDNTHSAECIAKQVGVDEVHSNCLPETKLKVIQQYQNNREMVCMIGDGVNDAPALKTAFVGIAMGGIGSDIAIDASDIALVSDDIKALPHLLKLSRKTMNTIKINLTASMLLNFAAIILAIMGILNPVVGALVHNVGSVVVIINSSLLLTWRSEK